MSGTLVKALNTANRPTRRRLARSMATSAAEGPADGDDPVGRDAAARGQIVIGRVGGRVEGLVRTACRNSCRIRGNRRPARLRRGVGKDRIRFSDQATAGAVPVEIKKSWLRRRNADRLDRWAGGPGRKELRCGHQLRFGDGLDRSRLVGVWRFRVCFGRRAPGKRMDCWEKQLKERRVRK